MRRVTNKDILQINSLYFQYKNYAEVARQTGFAASTVKKYVIKDWAPPKKDIVKFDFNKLPAFNSSFFKGIDNYGILCVLSENEVEEMKELWEELSV